MLSACSSRPVSILEPSAMNVSHTAKWKCSRLYIFTRVPGCMFFFLCLCVCVSCMHWEMLRRQRKCSQIFVFHPRLPAPFPPLQSHHYLLPSVQVNVSARHTPPPGDRHTHTPVMQQGQDSVYWCMCESKPRTAETERERERCKKHM